MKKTVKLIFALCLMAALVLTLAACGDRDPVGTWECTNYKDLVIDAAVAQGIDRAQIEELLPQMGGITMTADFDKDGTFSMKLAVMGESQEFTGTWKATNKGVDATVDGDTQAFLWDGDKLTLSGDTGLGLGETTLVFEKK